MRRTVVVAVLALVVAGFAAPAVANSADTDSAADLGLEELRPDGERPANAPPSVRAGGTYSEYAVKYLPTGLFVDESDESSSWNYLESGTTVKRDKVQLWSKRGYGESSKDVTIRVAYYETERQQVERGNETRMETVATNVTTHSMSATLSGGYDYVEVPLRSHFDKSVQATMCVEEAGEPNCLTNPGETRWRFTHSTSAAAQAVSYNTAGGQIGWALGLLVLPFALFTAGTLWTARKFIRAARSGPRISMLVWFGVIIAMFIAIAAFWDSVVATIVSAPWVLSIVSGVLLGILASEWFGDESYLALFLRLRLKDAVDETAYTPTSVPGESSQADSGREALADGGEEYRNANLNDVPGTLVADAIPLRMARSASGSRSRIGRGFWKFIARVRGARADLEVDGNISTKIDVEEGPYSELYVLDPEDEKPVEYKGERHRFEFPELISRDEEGRVNVNFRALFGGLFVLGTSHVAGDVLLASSTLGLLVGAFLLFVTKIAQPEPGYLRANLAPVHYGSALQTLFGHAKALGDSKTWEDLYDEVTREKTQNKAEKQRLSDRRTTSQADEIMNEFVGEADDVDQEAPVDD
ncbi:hypothetical protein [Haloprofundus sp. MHR1]|uniref:hypothetical protein n=1 Tax=Haloprofundus sp. MHR1 TaxID=2572921 RepID=UPI0010BE46F7|nr:hypothetical protein [Haloprofundus sp. MHR1]QCJ47250.1 hypothetical protein FCF25_09030 [Haloprofundus sp. MHR1]